MEILKPVENTLHKIPTAASFLVSRLVGGAFGILGDNYGEAVGGRKPAKITIFSTTPEEPAPLPDGMVLRDPPEAGWDCKPVQAA